MKISNKLEEFKEKSAFSCEEISDPTEFKSKVLQKYFDLYIEECVSISSAIFKGEKKQFVGAYSYMNDGGYINSNVFIGRYCSIGRRVSIGAGYHNIDGLTSSPFSSNVRSRSYTKKDAEYLNLGQKKKASVVIENDVWVGDGAVILNGVTIGTGAVIGANSVVAKDVPPYAIVGGVAAKQIKKRFPDEICEQILATQWWEHDREFIKQLPTRNILHFLEEYNSHPEKDNFKIFETINIKN